MGDTASHTAREKERKRDQGDVRNVSFTERTRALTSEAEVKEAGNARSARVNAVSCRNPQADTHRRHADNETCTQNWRDTAGSALVGAPAGLTCRDT